MCLPFYITILLTLANRLKFPITNIFVHFPYFCFFFFFNDPATPEISPLSLHDPLPIFTCSDFARKTLRATTPICWKHSLPAPLGCHPPRSHAIRFTAMNAPNGWISHGLLIWNEIGRAHV